MFICDKNKDNIDIYTIHAKKEQLRKYREWVLQKYKTEDLFCSLRTNDKKTIELFKPTGFLSTTNNEINIRCLDYGRFLYYYSNDRIPLSNLWSWLSPIYSFSTFDKEEQKKILEKYANGKYDSLKPIRIYEHDSNKTNEEIYRLLQPEGLMIHHEEIIRDCHYIIYYEARHMINLPRDLYLLHLFQNGDFSKLTSENIDMQLKFFEVEYFKSVKISDVSDMISFGLLSGTLEDAIKKAEIGSSILQKMKK